MSKGEKRGFARGGAILAGVAAIAVVVAVGRYVMHSTEPTRGARKEGSGERRGKGERVSDPLPYISYVQMRAEDRGKAGTTVNKVGRAYEGYNLYVQKPESAAILVDMQGEVVHRWASDVTQAKMTVPSDWRGWELARMMPNGDLLAVTFRRSIIKLDWDSKVKWTLEIPTHHEVVIAPDGKLWALYAHPRQVEMGGKQRLLIDEGIVVIDPDDGKEQKRISFYDIFVKEPTLKGELDRFAIARSRTLDEKGVDSIATVPRKDAFEKETRSKPDFLAHANEVFKTGKIAGLSEYETLVVMRAMPGSSFDLLHSNTIVPLKKHPAGLWKDGDVLISFRNLNLLAAIDLKEEKIVWSWHPDGVYGQHEPSVLENGNILLFDNGRDRSSGAVGAANPGAKKRKYSRVVELDPAAKKEVWSYMGDPPHSVYAPAESGCQMLPNGDILVATEGGRAFELTRAKEIVWEYYNPKLDPTKKYRSGMYRMERYAPDFVKPLLSKSPAGAAASAAPSAAASAQP